MFSGSRDPFPTHQTVASFPEKLEEGQKIFRHLEEKGARVTHHFPGHLVDLPAHRLDLGPAK